MVPLKPNRITRHTAYHKNNTTILATSNTIGKNRRYDNKPLGLSERDNEKGDFKLENILQGNDQ